MGRMKDPLLRAFEEDLIVMPDNKKWEAAPRSQRAGNERKSNMSQRFSYVKYDDISIVKQENLKKLFELVEEMAEAALAPGREKALFMTHLEIAYMWTGKAIRDEQIVRDAKTEHAPERG